jgi:predicted RNA-binding Zn ribbon-like protein
MGVLKVMQSEGTLDERPDAFFIASVLGLDFLNTIATPVDVPVEWLSSGDDLLDWLQKADLVPTEAIGALRSATNARELDARATRARALREWFRGFVHAHRGNPLDRRALRELGPLNELLAQDRQFERIVPGAREPLCLARQRRWDSPETLLLPIAHAVADVVCNEDFALIKACEGPLCSLLYVDRTRTHARKWCSMAVCGNRRKQAVHRKRKQA